MSMHSSVRSSDSSATWFWYYRHLTLIMAWIWSANLIFFPTWLFASGENWMRLKLLTLIIAWILISCTILWTWQRRIISSGKSFSIRKSNFSGIRSFFYFLIIPLLFVLNLIAANYPLTSGGDEDLHARTFRTIGQGIETLLSSKFPGHPYLWYCIVTLSIVLLIVARRRLDIAPNPHMVYRIAILTLVFGVISGSYYFWKHIDQLVLSVFPEFELNNLKALTRFPPLSKFLWLPASILGWRSVFVLRIPVVLCWLLSGIILYQTIRLKNDSYMAIFPAVYFLVLPGMFYYGHLLYLTAPMLIFWCITLYCFERYERFADRRFLVLSAISLCMGTLVRRETGFFALAVCAYWGWGMLRRKQFTKEMFLDLFGLLWFGFSFNMLWAQISKLNPYTGYANLSNLLEFEKLFCAINDFPYHIGPIATIALLIVLFLIFVIKRPLYYSKPILHIGMISIGISYILYVLFYVVKDERMIGLISFSSQWQTAHRFLASWSPFIALLLAEGVGQIKNNSWRPLIGIGMGIILFFQATFWSSPIMLPEFTSINLQPGSENPHLPASEVVRYISDNLAVPHSKIQVSRELAVSYFSDLLNAKGIWYRNGGKASKWTGEKGYMLKPDENQTVDKIARYCKDNGINFIVVPLVWLEGVAIKPDVSRKLLTDERFEVKQVFDYLGQPAILVAEFLK